MPTASDIDAALARAEAALNAEGLTLGPGDTLSIGDDGDEGLRAYVTFADGGEHALQLGDHPTSPR